MAKKDGKRKSNSKKERWPGLNVRRQVKNRQEYLDYDYIDQLSDEEKDFLNKFNKEFYMASFSKEEEKRLIKDPKKSYNANNARNRCMLSKAKSTGLLDNAPTKEYLNSKIDEAFGPYNNETEDSIITRIALKRNYVPESPDDSEDGSD